MSKVFQSASSASTIRRLGLVAVTACLLSGALAACNTTEGVGKDIKSAGEGIEDTARDAKN